MSSSPTCVPRKNELLIVPSRIDVPLVRRVILEVIPKVESRISVL